MCQTEQDGGEDSGAYQLALGSRRHRRKKQDGQSMKRKNVSLEDPELAERQDEESTQKK